MPINDPSASLRKLKMVIVYNRRTVWHSLTCWIINVYHLFNSRNFLGVTYGVQNVIFVHYFPVNIIFNHSFRTNICFDRTTAFYIPWWHGMPVFDAFREFTHTKVINGCASLITQANLCLPMWKDAFIDYFAWLLS